VADGREPDRRARGTRGEPAASTRSAQPVAVPIDVPESVSGA
jgi:hypothetical protein